MIPNVAASPPERYCGRVLPAWVDYNGHMSEAYYVLVFGYATDALLDAIGMDAVTRDRTGLSLYTLEAHICYLAEMLEGEPLSVTTQVLAVDDKRAHIFHRMQRDAQLVATGELLLCNVDSEAARSAPFPDEVATELRRLCETHRDLPTDARIGRRIALPG